MKIDCGMTREERDAYLKKWHPFFAILPRRVGSRDCRFLERIERRGRIEWKCTLSSYPFSVQVWKWEYRACE